MSKKEKIRVFFDTETYTDYNQILQAYLIGWCTDKDPENFHYSLEPHNEFFDELARLSLDYDVELWAHNCQYDLYILYPNYLARLPHHKPEKTWQTTEDGQFLKFSYKGIRGNTIKFNAYCTYKWDRGSLGYWAESLKLSVRKGVIDYDKQHHCNLVDGYFCFLNSEGIENKSSLKEETDYLKDDIFILFSLWKNIREQKKSILALYKLEPTKRDPLTIPAFGKLLVNRLMGGSDKLDLYSMTYKTLTEKELGIYMENTRMGGFTAYNKNIPSLFFDKPRIKSYDINSMYPTIMRSGLPYGGFVSKSETTITWFLCTFKNIKWKEKYNFFSRAPITSTFKDSPVFVCEVYLNLLRDVTDGDIDVIDEYYQEYGERKELNELIDKSFKIKSDESLPKYVRNGQKKCMNSQYGKFMERNHHCDYFYDIDAGGVIEHHPEEPRPYKSNLTGCYIVQLAQSTLIHHVIEEHEKGNTFVYCDTDSLKMLEVVEPSFAVGWRLGEWKFEGEFYIYMNLGKAKKYFLWNHDYPIDKQQIKMSGIETSIMKWIFTNFTLEDYIVLFKNTNNVLIVDGKNCSSKTKLGQPIIKRTNIEFNKGIAVTHHLDITKDKYLWEIKT